MTEFITKKTGVRWEDVTVDGITVDDLDAESFKIFVSASLTVNAEAFVKVWIAHCRLTD